MFSTVTLPYLLVPPANVCCRDVVQSTGQQLAAAEGPWLAGWEDQMILSLLKSRA